MGRIVVVGLGPAGPELLTGDTVEAIAAHRRRFLRTVRHPAAVAVPGAESFDDVYDAADTFEEVYRTIAERLVQAAADSEVLYAVPGSPLVLERSVQHLRERADVDPDLEVEVRPAMSFLDVAWTRLGIDPVEAGVRLVDGHTFAVDAAGERGPLLVAHCHNQRVLSDVKLAVDEPGDLGAVVLQRLGLPDERITEVRWSDLDRDVQADHLTSIFVPTLTAPVASEVQRFAELVATLRTECPWDRQQTHYTLRHHLLEETYEVLEVLDRLGPGDQPDAETLADLEEELGDLLFQVTFHSVIAAGEGAFTLADVARGIHDKLRYRHPHVFADVEVDGTDQVIHNWEQLKRAEKGRDSALDGIPAGLPALPFAAKVLKKATGIGLRVPEPPGHLRAAVDDLLEQPSEVALGRMLLAAVLVARAEKLDPEDALRSVAAAVRDQVATLESHAGSEVAVDADLDDLLTGWVSRGR